ncbi:AsmA-like C-terminal region-containing protein [Ensifer sp. LCM 4579]|uniref:AsmA family protein n=1 Tax=Ensifer sp. LCM 4579 TaxID=1848292 RepID=UPI0008DA5A03|nr:AsmA family protein [Ensifer sp. LCM 4579]OHV85994.1 cell envelope biogenesis protein AsmA [Ensifer sp. LCM 4579]
MKRHILRASGALRHRLRARHIAWSAAAGVALAIGYNAAVPLLVSTTDVRATMERMLDGWSGGKTTIGGEPEIRFWPEPLVTLPSVKIVSRGPEPHLLAQIDRITASFSLISALSGESALDDVTLVAPIITIERRADGTINWQRPHWLIAPQAATQEDDSPFGDITVENGRLRISDALSGDSTGIDISGIAGTVKWPSYADRLSAQFSAVLGGQQVAWAFVCDRPLDLFAKRDTPVKTSITSAQLTLSFEGIGHLSLTPFASGHLQLSVPSLATLVAWYRGSADMVLPPADFSIDAKVTTGGKSLKLDELQLTLGDAAATGVLDVVLPGGGSPRIGGTLAFDRIDFNALPASMPVRPERSDRLWQMAENYINGWRTDLRISAQDVLVGPLHLEDVATGVMVDGGRASLDIGDSTYAGGRLSGRAQLSTKGLEHGGRLQVTLKNADFAAVFADFGLKGPMPVGNGILNLDVASNRAFWETATGDLSGSLTYRLRNGSLAGFDVHAFTDLVRKGEFFSLSQASDATFDFQIADFEASFAEGTARLDRARFVSPSGTMSVTGIIPYRSGSLVFAGALEDASAADDQPLRFFVGGTWPNAVVTPLSVLVGPN